jgi:hypothetical protein
MGANIQKNIVFVIFAKQFLLLIIAEYFVDYDTFERFFVPLFRVCSAVVSPCGTDYGMFKRVCPVRHAFRQAEKSARLED